MLRLHKPPHDIAPPASDRAQQNTGPAVHRRREASHPRQASDSGIRRNSRPSNGSRHLDGNDQRLWVLANRHTPAACKRHPEACKFHNWRCNKFVPPCTKPAHRTGLHSHRRPRELAVECAPVSWLRSRGQGKTRTRQSRFALPSRSPWFNCVQGVFGAQNLALFCCDETTATLPSVPSTRHS